MLKGTPTQMLTRITETSASEVSVSQGTPDETRWSLPSASLTTPESVSSIHFHVVAETTSGSSHGSIRSDRRTPLSGKRCWKKRAMARPSTNCPMIEPAVNRTVVTKVWENRSDDRILA